MRSVRFAEEAARTRARLTTLLNHPGHDQKSHGRKGSGRVVEGRDLLANRNPGDLAREVVAASADYRTPWGEGDGRMVADPGLSAIAAEQGFDGPPRVVSREEMDQLVAGGSTEIFRGMDSLGAGTDSERAVSPEQMAEQLRSGDAYFGRGFAGNGYYFGTGEMGRTDAELHAQDGGSFVRATLDRSARIASADEVSDRWRSFVAEHDISTRGSSAWDAERPPMDAVFGDKGRFAAATGIDAFWVTEGHELVVLNRTKLIVEEA